MAYTDVSDPVIDALLLVALRRVTKEMLPTLGPNHPPILSCYPYPATVEEFSALNRPSLSASRTQTEGAELPEYGRHYYRQASIRFQYLSHDVTQEKFGATWPLLQAVATEVHKATISAPATVLTDADVAADRAVLEQAGIIDVSEAFTARGFSLEGEGAPSVLAWEGTLEVVYDAETPRRDLGLLRELYAQFDLYDGRDDPNPFVSLLQMLAKAGSGYSSGFDARAHG